MMSKGLRNDGESHDPSARDIPAHVDLQAVVAIVKKFYPHLDAEEIRERLLQVMQPQPVAG